MHGFFISTAQVYNNEWIDYNKTYYKFKIGTTGLYRITQATLIQLAWEMLQQRPFSYGETGNRFHYIRQCLPDHSGSSDYIEFWGEMNDGKPDNAVISQILTTN